MTANSMRDIKRAAKVAKDAVLSKLCDQIAISRQNAKNNKIPYGFVAKQVKDMRHFCPWLTRDAVMNAHRKREKTARQFENNTHNECIICLQHPRTHAFVPCGHLCICNDCVRKAITHGSCPVCRVEATQVMKVFFS